jgi:multidrug efflux pump subunit AcrA (membrane-fusion protein)
MDPGRRSQCPRCRVEFTEENFADHIQTCQADPLLVKREKKRIIVPVAGENQRVDEQSKKAEAERQRDSEMESAMASSWVEQSARWYQPDEERRQADEERKQADEERRQAEELRSSAEEDRRRVERIERRIGAFCAPYFVLENIEEFDELELARRENNFIRASD